MEIVTYLLAHWQELLTSGLVVVGSFTAFLAALYAFFLLIPGDQPDKAIKAFLDLTSKLSKK